MQGLAEIALLSRLGADYSPVLLATVKGTVACCGWGTETPLYFIDGLPVNKEEYLDARIKFTEMVPKSEQLQINVFLKDGDEEQPRWDILRRKDSLRPEFS